MTKIIANETTSELEQPMWAVATQSKVLDVDLTYAQAIELVNENLSVSGIAIVTAESARRQNREHSFYKCEDTCEGCEYCNGGLLFCMICKQAEAELTKICPGSKEKQIYV